MQSILLREYDRQHRPMVRQKPTLHELLLNDKTALVRYVGRKKTNPYII